MRIGTLFLTATLASTTTVSANAQVDQPVIQYSQINGSPFFADRQSQATLGSLSIELSRVADKGVLFLDPAAALRLKFPEWSSLPMIKDSYPRLKSGIPSIQKFNDDLRRQLIMMGMLDIQDAAASVADGSNYMALRLNDQKSCIILGKTSDTNSSGNNIGLLLAGLPQSFSNYPIFKNLDQRSFLILILLHETAHCAQTDDSAERNDPVIKTLRREIGADTVASREYRHLVSSGWSLDPSAPEKLSAMRALSAIYSLSGAKQSILYFVVGSPDHSTSLGIKRDVSTIDIAKMASISTYSARFLAMSIVYDMLNDGERKSYLSRAIKEQTEDFTAINGARKTLPDFADFLTKAAIVHQAVLERPERLIEAAKAAAAFKLKSITDIADKNGDLSGQVELIGTAWDNLGLEYSKTNVEHIQDFYQQRGDTIDLGKMDFMSDLMAGMKYLELQYLKNVEAAKSPKPQL